MRIDFDSGNSVELAAVAALVSSLYGQPLQPGASVAAPLAPLAPLAPPSAPVAESPIETVAEALPPVAPPPPISAPVAAPPLPDSSTASLAPSGVDLDTAGLPYDARIHSNPPSKKKDGHWRGKRGLDDATRDAVTAELRAALAAPAAVAPVAPPPMFEEAAPGVPLPPPPGEPVADAAMAFAAPVAAPAVSPPPPPVAAVAPPPPPPVAPAVVPAAPVAEGPATNFPELMKKITARQTAGVLTVADTTATAVALGLTGVRDLMVRPDLIESFDALLPPLA